MRLELEWFDDGARLAMQRYDRHGKLTSVWNLTDAETATLRAFLVDSGHPEASA